MPVRLNRLLFLSACVLMLAAAFTLAQQKSNRGRSLQYVPRDAIAVFSVDVQALLSSQMLAATAAEIGEQSLPMLQLPTSKVTDVTFVVLNGGACAKLNLNPEGKQLLWKRIQSMGQETVLDGIKFFKNRDGVFHQLEDGSTLVASSEVILLRALKTESAESSVWANQWNAAKSPVVGLLNTSLLRATSTFLENFLPRLDSGAAPNRDMISLANRSDRIWIEFQPDPVPALSVRGQCPTPEEAMSFEGGLRTAISMARSLISTARTEALDPAKAGREEALPIMDFLDKVLEFATVQRKESQVAALARVSEADSKKVPGLLSLAMKTFTVSQSKVATQNNLRQIAIGMLNYEATYKQFPAAVQEGPKQMPRSWRVTLLPYIGHLDLYNRYKQDEPWDSPSNVKLLNEIPTVYQGSQGGSNSAYFVFAGGNSVFNGNAVPRIGEITDGTGYTILAVEAELAVPWTKPDDIPFDANQPLPDFLKKGFHAVAVDGSCYFIPPNADESEVKQAITKNGGSNHKLFQR
jgi:hypothetical protein